MCPRDEGFQRGGIEKESRAFSREPCPRPASIVDNDHSARSIGIIAIREDNVRPLAVSESNSYRVIA